LTDVSEAFTASVIRAVHNKEYGWINEITAFQVVVLLFRNLPTA
jgi:hypothetical protein